MLHKLLETLTCGALVPHKSSNHSLLVSKPNAVKTEESTLIRFILIIYSPYFSFKNAVTVSRNCAASETSFCVSEMEQT